MKVVRLYQTKEINNFKDSRSVLHHKHLPTEAYLEGSNQHSSTFNVMSRDSLK